MLSADLVGTSVSKCHVRMLVVDRSSTYLYIHMLFMMCVWILLLLLYASARYMYHAWLNWTNNQCGPILHISFVYLFKFNHKCCKHYLLIDPVPNIYTKMKLFLFLFYIFHYLHHAPCIYYIHVSYIQYICIFVYVHYALFNEGYIFIVFQ